jgi:error-prone DNA polymerase
VLTARLLMVRGRVQREGIVIHVLAEHLEDCSDLLATLGGRKLTPPYTPADHVAHPNGPDSREPKPPPIPRHPRDQAKVLFPSRDFH